VAMQIAAQLLSNSASKLAHERQYRNSAALPIGMPQGRCVTLD
jgi:hypothetical protein